MIDLLKDIGGSAEWEDVQKISKGWSDDTKYRIKTKSGDNLLLRISNSEKYTDKKNEYEIIKKFSELGFNMSLPVGFGSCNQGHNVYMLLSWVEGQDLEEVLPRLSEEEQYHLGRQAGEILKRIHSLKVDKEKIPQKTKVEKKLLQLKRYEESKVRIENDEIAVQYVRDNIEKIWSKDAAYLHGDFHPGNLIYMGNGSIGVIDFNRWEVGDPYEEFYKLESFGRDLSTAYCIGQLDAYFNDCIPDDFWEISTVYVAHASVFSIKWAEKFGQEDVDNMVKRCLLAFEDYDYFKRTIPLWYDSELKNKWKGKL